MNPDSLGAPRLKSRFQKQTREAILAAAEGTIAQVGVHAARMEDIASKAGVAVGTVYNYFKDRQQLVTALVDVRRAELIERIDAVLIDPSLCAFDDRLRAFLRTSLLHFDEHRTLFTLMLQEELDLSHNAQARLSMIRGLTLRIERLIAFGSEAGVFQFESTLLPALLLGLLRGVIMQSLLSDDDGALTDHVEPLVHFFMHGAGYS